MTTFTTDTPALAAPILAALRRFGSAAATRFAEWRARRSAADTLGRLKPRDLRDIGLIETDLHATSQKPLSQNASDALYRASLGRAGNW